MVRVVMNTLRGSERVTRASLFLLDRQGSALRLRGHTGAPTPPSSLDLATRRPLLERMRQSGPLLRDVLERQRERANNELKAELDECLDTFAEVGASLALPIRGLAGEQIDGGPPRLHLLGVLFVDDERLLEPFSREEVELFEGVVAQAAVMIENSTVFEQRKERDRLAALGEMAAGLAHEIRNPLGAIKGAVQVVEPGLQNADPTTREFLGVIVEEVERLNRVVTQFSPTRGPSPGRWGRSCSARSWSPPCGCSTRTPAGGSPSPRRRTCRRSAATPRPCARSCSTSCATPSTRWPARARRGGCSWRSACAGTGSAAVTR
nr:GAF domain-containing sensor histidine kinase [Nannocystis pusilla]